MANDYYFFTDINQQASNATDYINVQTAAGAYGPIVPATAGMDEYRVTSLHTASYNPTAYAACEGIVCVQRIPVTITGTSPPLVNVILKPLVQPELNFAPVKYIIYNGILESSLINGAETAAAGNNDLTQSIWDDQKTRNAKEARAPTPFAPPNPSADALGVGRTAASSADFGDDQPIDKLFYNLGVQPLLKYQLPLVKGGWSIGKFDKSGFGIEVLMEGLGIGHSLSLTRQLESKISLPTLAGTATPKETFEHRHAKEQVLGYMDPCAFYGSFFLAGLMAKTSGTVPFVKKAGNALYQDVLFAFANKNKAYLDIRNEHGFSFDYFTNYGRNIQISYDPANVNPAAVDYYASLWPILTLIGPSFPATNTTKARNVFKIQLPVGDNPQPLLYVSQGYRDINRKRKGFPAELKSAERFYDAFEPPVGGFTATRNKSGLTSMTFAVPNVTGQAATVPASCYIRLKYLKQTQGTTASLTVIQSSSYLDNLFYPIDLRILLGGFGKMKSFVYDEELYVNALGVAGLGFDFIAKVGIARDSHNTSFFLTPTIIRTNAAQASTLVTLSGEVSFNDIHYPNFVALKYPLERVTASNPVLSVAGQVPVAKFSSDGDAATQAKFNVPDFGKFFIIVVANATYDSWATRIAATGAALDNRFRIYLGIKILPAETDSLGIQYTPFELVLRGFAYDTSAGHYKVEEMNTGPITGTTNAKVYTHAGT